MFIVSTEVNNGINNSPPIQADSEFNPQYTVNTNPSSEISQKSVKTPQQETSTSNLQTTQSVGESRLFWVPNIETMDHYQINVTLRVEGPHCLIYSDLSSSLDPMFQNMNRSFERVIYPSLQEFYGSPSDLDGNHKIIILVFDIIDGLGSGQYVAGFFYALNQYLNKDLTPSQKYSNEAEIIHIDGNQGLSQLNAGDFETIAHEFQHMIHFVHDDDENIWLDEGASMFAEFLIGEDPFADDDYLLKFRSNPHVSLTYWDYYDSQGLVMANYAAAYAFFLYLAEHYGGASIIQKIVNQSANSAVSVMYALQEEGYTAQFKEVFRNWTIANYLDDTSFAGGAYGYYNTSRIMSDSSLEGEFYTSAISRNENSVPYWGTDYFKFNNRLGLPFNLEFQGDRTSRFLVTAIFTNTTSFPFNTKVVPIELSPGQYGNFSLETYGLSADEIVLAISSHTKLGDLDHNDDDPAPAQDYWFIMNPMGIIISSGDVTYSTSKLSLDIRNIQVNDQNGFYWHDADGATYEIISESGDSTGINGDLTFNLQTNFWEALAIDISGLSAGNNTYRIKYHFFNETSSGIAFSEPFSIILNSSTNSSSMDNSPSPITGFMLVISILAISLLIKNRKKD